MHQKLDRVLLSAARLRLHFWLKTDFARWFPLLFHLLASFIFNYLQSFFVFLLTLLFVSLQDASQPLLVIGKEAAKT